jgi:hypothetical protein
MLKLVYCRMMVNIDNFTQYASQQKNICTTGFLFTHAWVIPTFWYQIR